MKNSNWEEDSNREFLRLRKGKILVTGGAGLIGSALVWALNNLGLEDIILCDRLSDDDRYKNLIPLHFT
ncbi:MAG: NAD-dependent epimerase/dehydratase family protein, partial [Puniceicoccales bacterium]|nr:NAD-dependent epimerase/dehydratase family protein [Puniceicoccales bacterium]